MPDASLILRDGYIDYNYLGEWCAAGGGSLEDGPAGCCRIAMPGTGGKKKLFFWLHRLGSPGTGRPLGACWRGHTFTGPEAYLPGMLAVLLEAVDGSGRKVEVILTQGNEIPAPSDREGLYYFLLPTDFQLALAHKGEYEVEVKIPGSTGGIFGFQGVYEEENEFMRSLEESLAPRHPIYPVGPGAPEFIRPFFLLGHRQAVLRAMSRDEEGFRLVYRLNALPGDGAGEVGAHFREALAAAGGAGVNIEVRLVHPGGRSQATRQDLEPLYRAYYRATGLQPDMDWFMWPSPAGLLCGMGYKTAAFGPGRYRDFLAGADFDPEAGGKLGLILRSLLMEGNPG